MIKGLSLRKSIVIKIDWKLGLCKLLVTKTKKDTNSIHCVGIESCFIIAFFNSQAYRLYIRPEISLKFGKVINGPVLLVWIADDHTQNINGHAAFVVQIADFSIPFKAVILDNLYCDIFIGHNFLMKNEVFWDYLARTIYMRTSVCWTKTISSLRLGDFDFSEIKISSDTIFYDRIKDILLRYFEVFSGKINRTKLTDLEIWVKIRLQLL